MTSIALPQIGRGGESRYRGYAYAYPHKTAYRHLSPARALSEVWAGEAKESLFLYVHLPFCEMRCGFCNLFTLAQPADSLVAEYLRALSLEVEAAREALGEARFVQMAIGGGTPTFLDERQIEALFEMLGRAWKVEWGRVPMSVETSPRTATVEKMRLLKARGATRVSMGVQSFIEAEVAASGRAQSNTLVERAIENIRRAGIATMNLDLIYGLPGQSVRSWRQSVGAAIAHEPDELYLYPLYVRPLTGLARQEAADDDVRVACYEEAREMLAGAGYEQVSMRMFRRRGAGGGTEYCCQDDGMVGLGCGARSYTRALHYSREFAVGREGVKSILRAYLARGVEDFRTVDYGCELDAAEQRRRYVIKSVLRVGGLSLADYRARFRGDPRMDVPELGEWIAGDFLHESGGVLRPTQRGIDHSDVIGPALFSPAMRETMEHFELR